MKLCEKIAAKRAVEQLERENKPLKNVGAARPRRPSTSTYTVEAMIDKIKRKEAYKTARFIQSGCLLQSTYSNAGRQNDRLWVI